MENFEANKTIVNQDDIDAKFKELFYASRAGQDFSDTAFAKKLVARIEKQNTKFSILLSLAQIVFVISLLAALYLLPKSIGNFGALYAELNSFIGSNEKPIYFAIIIFGTAFLKFANRRDSII